MKNNYPDGGTFWKGATPPSSTAKPSLGAKVRMGMDMMKRGAKKRKAMVKESFVELYHRTAGRLK